MDDLISKASVCEILADIYPTDGEKVVAVKEIDKAYEAIQQLPPAQPEQESFEWCHDCKEYDQEQHCCHRWTKAIRKTVDELKQSAQHGTWQQCYITTQTGGQHCVWECDGCGARVAERTKFCAECGRRMTG